MTHDFYLGGFITLLIIGLAIRIQKYFDKRKKVLVKEYWDNRTGYHRIEIDHHTSTEEE